MAWQEVDDATRALLGPAAPLEDLDRALRRPRAPCGSASGLHELAGPGVRWIQRLPGGGVAWCLHCGYPVFVPPETCVERIDLDEIEGTFHFSDLTRS